MTPPEGLGLALFRPECIQDPYPLYRRMLDTAPVHPIADSGFYAVCGWDAVNDAIARPENFSSNLTATMTYQADGTVGAFEMESLGGKSHVLATADEPAHTAHRKALLPQLAARRIRAFEPFILETANSLWHSHLHDGHIEWMSAVANRLPMMIVGRLIGVPDADVDKLVRWGYSATQVVEGLVGQDQLTQATVAVMELAGYITDQFRHAAQDPQDNLLGDLATACATGEMDELTAQSMMIILFSAGGESTASLIGSAAWILASRPDIQEHLRAKPELLGAFVEEVLRYEPPFRGHYRHVVHDTTLGGVDLPAGSRLLLLWGAANRDPSHFDAPDEFRLDRSSAKSHLSFGKGTHFCVGAALARLEALVVLRHLLHNTANITAGDTGPWLPSLLVRRLAHLELVTT
ncbi:cytochrome P450 [Mycolicibacterium smegmatis]|uniref:Cytochrome P450 144 n=4 Tax=Mycolicibacterium smegmatis TaxID=1772 RepID=A0QQ96_MYCS2|nr:cytochrome P450 [Mycolicibacterium smegmatis]ABK74294.1 putative cytochrome P450 144 [Mycolicibacterium smegmatis MC2 155]AFP37139.1 Cytochrome P450 144 cyp144 [Mycolicibacterium smegmatis MC2 155]AIU05940.1 cytochrome P450 [Mycolicibacterium smegmatis MC2 155]AIU12565.1 cytochrome P450 [Mycolicibacterium smegmatis]AIU19189.1 cytochrome P450 [Mycolicibacterium smegmatis]